MAVAKKLPSGSWRALVYDYTDEKGKRHYKSFTSSDQTTAGKREAERLAAEYAASKEEVTRCDMTFGEAAASYVANRAAVLSPRTIESYRSIIRNHFESLSRIPVTKIRNDDIQRLINHAAEHESSKTVRNIHGVISAVMSSYRPEFVLRTDLPKVYAPKLYIPTDEDVERLLASVRGTFMELPVLLAACGSMRRGEICAQRAENIDGNVVHVCENMVKKDGSWIIKPPKSVSGDRYIIMPDFVCRLWEGKEGRIVKANPDTITREFISILDETGIPHFRFHDLRHFSASVQHSLGIPDAYIMQRGGWGSDKVLKNVYRHAMTDRQTQMADIVNGHFEELYKGKK